MRDTDKSAAASSLPGVCGKKRASHLLDTGPDGYSVQVVYANLFCSSSGSEVEITDRLDGPCDDDATFLSQCYNECRNQYGYYHASLTPRLSAPDGSAVNRCFCHKSCNKFHRTAPTDLVWAIAVPVDWLLFNAESHASKVGLTRPPLGAAAKASPPASTFESDLTCDTYKQWPIDNMGLHVVRCEGKDACKEDPPKRINADVDQLGTLLVCDGEKACADSTFFMDDAGPALPVVALCCGEGACDGFHQCAN